jgi:hypothetical protein
MLAAIFAGATFTGASAQTPPGSPHGCTNPAGHVRGWCKRSGREGTSTITIAGTALAVNGDLVQFREDRGTTITIDQSSLLRSGQGLQAGAHYTLQGYFSNNLFLAQPYGDGYYGDVAPYPNNGYPYPGSTASVHGIITAVGADRVTLMQGLFATITINDQQAINNGTAQNLFIGRSITAWGYWSGGTFYATSIG